MSRFVIPAKGMRLNTSGKSSTLAFFTVIDTKIGIEFRDVQLKQRRDGGVFVSAPFRSYERNEGGADDSKGGTWPRSTSGLTDRSRFGFKSRTR